ncbi:putative Major facilitator superfamily domain, general substrate transporter [Seiridium cardinale]
MNYPTALKFALIVIELQLSTLCIALDNTIVAAAIPRISDEFYAFSNLFFGPLYSVFNIKMSFLLSLLHFEVRFLFCALAPNSTALIIGRAIAGVGSARLFSGALIILTFSTLLEDRPIFTGLIIAIYGIDSVVGP